MSFQFDEINRLSAKASYDLSGLPESADRPARHKLKFSVEYTHSFGIPVSRKSGLGAVRGEARNVETGEPLRHVIVRLGRYAVATDAQGGFLFPTLEPGTYYIDTDTSLTDSRLVPLVRTPIEVAVNEREDTVIEIGFGSPADLEGTVTIYEFSDSGEQFDQGAQAEEREVPSDEALTPAEPAVEDEYVPRGGESGVLIIITDGRQTHRRVTNEKGYFIFEDLPPGKWSLEVSSANLPRYHYVENEEYELELTPGATETISVRILPEKREIEIIDEGEILLESD
jgi:hypothetical protein